jgi:hypothetical protein
MWNSIPNEDLLKVRALVSPDGWGRLELFSSMSIPEVFSLLLGEMLYQLRSSLDACIYQASIYATAQDPPPSGEKAEFPITFVPSEFAKLAKRRLSDLPENLQAAIENLQPYHKPTGTPEQIITSINRSLGILNDLARKDRHRKLHVVGSWAVAANPQFDLPPGVTLTSIETMKSGHIGVITELARFHLDGFVTGMAIRANPNLTTAIGLNEPPEPCDALDTFGQRLAEMMTAVNSIICAFEQYF